MAVLHHLVEAIGKSKALDKPADGFARLTEPLVRRQPLFDLLNGSWLGHPLHPLLIAGPLGAWFSAALLDALGGEANDRAADTLVAAGAVAAVPTALAGVAQWIDTYERPRRLGVVHAGLNNAALVMQVASVLARRRGNRRRGIGLSLGALGAVTAGGYLGGHMSYALGVGVDHTAFTSGPAAWTSTGVRDDAVAEGALTFVEADGYQVLLTRSSGRLRAYDDRCSHAGGPLHEGEVVDGCVQCPWHGSRFFLDSGNVAASPATAPQSRFTVRVVDGVVEVRAA